MNILYDISILGVGHHTTRARTGIFRVIENLAYQLAISNECNLKFCTTQSPLRLLQVLDYLEDNQELSKNQLIYSEGNVASNRYFYQKHLNLTNKIQNSNNYSQLFLKVIRKTIGYINSLKNISYESIPNNYLEEIDIFHSPFEIIPDSIRRNKKITSFLTVYDLIPILFPQYFNFNERADVDNTLKSIDSDMWILCISEATKRDLCNYLPQINPSKICVTYLAASDLFFKCTDSDKLDYIHSKYCIPKAPYILSLSTLEPRKNITQTIRSFLNVVQQEKLQDLHLVLAGAKGWNYDAIFAEIVSNPTLRDRIIVTGYVPDEDLSPLYSGALAFVYPSFYEGFGLPPLEAMKCGTPVITSNTSSLPEVVGNAGYMLDPNDLDGLSQAILKLYQSPSLRENMSHMSLVQANKFSWEHCLKQTVSAYRDSLSS